MQATFHPMGLLCLLNWLRRTASLSYTRTVFSRFIRLFLKVFGFAAGQFGFFFGGGDRRFNKIVIFT